ncbi:acyl-[acyl-carrier-protein] thioesterase [Bacteroidales bacterium OttesenSCG-928-A17]|nr:acyl-[acyl-carrier-protein] thioesterase [Bacteroidales bacterium OttesenSCG-928-A17]
MLSKIGSYKFPIESYVCDFTEKATLPLVCNFMLKAATTHAQERGFGYDDISKDNCAWVLSRVSIEMLEYPGYDQNLTVETWVEDVSRFFTQRCFAFVDKDGKTIGYARTIWAALDMNTRRPVDIPAWRPDLIDYVDKEKSCPIDKLAKIPELNEIEPKMGYTIRYSDIDINKHMNSVKYIEHILNVFGLELFDQKKISRFDMVYLQEGHFGEKLKIHVDPLNDDEYIIDTKSNDESICRTRILWK